MSDRQYSCIHSFARKGIAVAVTRAAEVRLPLLLLPLLQQLLLLLPFVTCSVVFLPRPLLRRLLPLF